MTRKMIWVKRPPSGIPLVMVLDTDGSLAIGYGGEMRSAWAARGQAGRVWTRKEAEEEAARCGFVAVKRREEQ